MSNLQPTLATIDAMRFGSFLVEAQLTVYQLGVPTDFIVPISTMSITVDRNSAQRRTGTITIELVPSIPPPPIMPTSPSSVLAPFGTEIFVQTGIATSQGSQYNNGVLQWIPSGLFDIATTVVDDTTTNLVVSLQVYDRSWVISQRLFLQPYNFPAVGGNFVDEMVALLNQVWGSTLPPLTFNITPTTATVPTATYNQGADPWGAAQDMAAAVGYELFFDVNGVVTGLPIPNPVTQAITWNFTDDPTLIYGDPGTGLTALEGSPYSSPVECMVTFTRDQIYNDVYVAGTGSQNAAGGASGSTAPVLAEAADTNPLSPTYVNGPMGDIPEFISSNIVITTAQAQTMATNELQAALSASWQITITSPPNPIFDIDNVVTITRPRLGLYNVPIVIDTITHVVSYADLMSLSGRVVI